MNVILLDCQYRHKKIKYTPAEISNELNFSKSSSSLTIKNKNQSCREISNDFREAVVTTHKSSNSYMVISKQFEAQAFTVKIIIHHHRP